VTGLVAATTILMVLLFFTGPLRFIPVAALGAVLVRAALSLVDVKTLKGLLRLDKTEFGLAVLATLGVVAVGPVKAILVVVALSVVRFVKLVSRPKVEILGQVEGMPGFHGMGLHEGASREEGMVLFRFNAPIVFFNAPYFKREALEAVAAAGSGVKWFVMDMIPVTMVDATGLFVVQDVVNELKSLGVQFVVAGRRTEWEKWAERRGMSAEEWNVKMYPTLRSAVKELRGTASSG